MNDGRDGPGSSPSATSVSSAAALFTSGHASVAPVPSVLSMPSSSSAEARNRWSAWSRPAVAVAAAEHAVVGDRRGDARGHHQRGAGRHAVDHDQVALAGRHQHARRPSSRSRSRRTRPAPRPGRSRPGAGLARPARSTIRWCAARRRSCCGPDDEQVAHRRVGEARQHQRRAFVRADADAGARDARCRAACRRSPCRRGSPHAPGPPTSPRSTRALRVPCAILRSISRSCGASRLGHAGSRPPSAPCPGCARTPPPAAAPVSSCDTCSCGRLAAAATTMPSTARPWSAAKTTQLRIAKARLQRVLHQAEAHRQRLQLAQAAGGLAAPLQLVAQRLLEQRVGRGRDQRAVGGHGARSVRAAQRRAQSGRRTASAQEQAVDRVVGLVDARVGQRLEELAERRVVAARAPGCRPGCGRSRRPGCGSGTG